MAEHETEVDRPSWLDDPVPPMIEKSLAAFRRELPQFLHSHYRKWVAYHGDERIGFAKTQTELVEKCLARGLELDEFVVCGVEPEPDGEIEIGGAYIDFDDI